jgi:divalent metal cation (Fe/Co/Zn/Cd) transporter
VGADSGQPDSAEHAGGEAYSRIVIEEGVRVDSGRTREELESRGLRLEYATIVWNAIEMVVSIGLGIAARSLALVAFGLDTMVELFASGVVVWHLRHPGRDSDHITAQALRMVAGAFFVLALVVTVGAVWALVTGAAADESPIGIAYLALTVVVMLSLGATKRAIGIRLGSEPLAAEARMSILDAALALGVLIGLAANALFGLWWADPLAALLVGAAAIHEGIENLEEANDLTKFVG